MFAQRLVSKSKQSELSVRMTLTTGSLTSGGWTVMDAWSSFSRFNSESDVPPGTTWALSLKSVMRKKVPCNARSYICILRINYADWCALLVFRC